MTTSAPTTTTLGRDNSRTVSVRMTDEYFHHLIAQASLRGVSMAEVVRQIIEADIQATPDIGHEDGSPGRSMGYRDFLAIADFTAALEELQAQDAD